MTAATETVPHRAGQPYTWPAVWIAALALVLAVFLVRDRVSWAVGYPADWVVPVAGWIGAVMTWLKINLSWLTRSIAAVLGVPLDFALDLLAKNFKIGAGADAFSLPRLSWVGVCAAVALLLAMKDFRLLPVIPIVAAVFFAIAPPQITARFYSIFDMQDPTSRDRVAMLRTGVAMVKAHPFTGVGPTMVQPLYERYRDPSAVERVNPHLHNVPVQIAAERGLPALAVWLGFIGVLAAGVFRIFRGGQDRVVAASALAAIAAMLSAGMFEYNFGDSEFLMLFLVIITLPFAAERTDAHAAAPRSA